MHHAARTFTFANRHVGRQVLPEILLGIHRAELRWAIALALQADGCDITEANDGRELLDRIADSGLDVHARYDLIISEMSLPRVTGLDIACGLRDAHSTIPMILICAVNDEACYEKAKAVAAVLLAPFNIAALRQLVLEVLNLAKDGAELTQEPLSSFAKSIGIGASGFPRRPLPHHPACGPAPGGSKSWGYGASRGIPSASK